MNIQFAIPKLLLLIWLVPAVAAWWFVIDRRREQALERFVSSSMQARLRPDHPSTRFRWQLVLMATGLLLSIFAAARPQWGQRDEVVYSRGRDLIILLDVSRSMLASDVHPNRLQRARIDLVDLIAELRGDRAGLIAFRGGAIELCPLTTDYAYIKMALDAAGPDSAPRGETDIGKAIRVALETYETESGAHKALILVSDGEDLKGDAIKAARVAAEQGITIFTVGLGSEEGAQIPDANQSGGVAVHKGSSVITRLDNEALYEISRITGGAYIPIGTASLGNSTLGTLYRDHLRKISERDLEETLQRRFVERFQWFLFPGVLCMLVGMVFSRGRLQRNSASSSGTSTRGNNSSDSEGLKDLNPPPRELKALSLLFVMLFAAGTSPGATSNDAPVTASSADVPAGRDGARFAQKRYRQGDYAGAADAYLKAAADATRKSQLDFRYNAATALFRDGQLEEAADLLRQLSHTSGSHQGKTAQGLGASLFRASQTLKADDSETREKRLRLLREAADAFRLGARELPEDEVARRNVSVAIDQLQEQELEAKISELTEKYQSSGPEKVAAEMLAMQREINLGIRRAMTNASPSRIGELEALAEKQENNADLWIPLKGKLMAAFEQAGSKQSPAEVNQAIEATRENMLEAAGTLRDLDPNSDQVAQQSEAAIYQLWKAIAPPESILGEDLRQQTNVIIATVTPAEAVIPPQFAPMFQEEARELTRLFASKFSQVTPEETAPADPLSTNGVTQAPQGSGIDAETHAKIMDLAMQAEATQGAAMKLFESDELTKSLLQQQLSFKILKEIEALLPKPPPQESQQDAQQQPKEQDEQEQEEAPQEEPEESPEEPQQMPPEPEDRPEEEEPEAAEAEEQPDLPEDEVRRLLEQALQREREHEAEERKRRDSKSSSSMGRDW